MIRSILTVVILVSFGTVTFGGYIEDRKAATDLAKAGKQEEAMAAFIKMAEGKFTDLQKSDALHQAAYCANKLKQYDRAMELAGQIPLEPMSKTCQMSIMVNNRKQAEVVEKFKDENIAAWPDSVKGEAYYNRAKAFLSAKNGAAAEKDLVQAIPYIPDRRIKRKALTTLASTYANLLKNDDRAIETYRKLYDMGDIKRQSDAVIYIANILQQQAKYDQALQELKLIDMKLVKDAYTRSRMLCAMGDALAGAGQKAEAAAKYKEALQVKDIPDKIKQSCEKKIAEIDASTQ